MGLPRVESGDVVGLPSSYIRLIDKLGSQRSLMFLSTISRLSQNVQCLVGTTNCAERNIHVAIVDPYNMHHHKTSNSNSMHAYQTKHYPISSIYFMSLKYIRPYNARLPVNATMLLHVHVSSTNQVCSKTSCSRTRT